MGFEPESLPRIQPSRCIIVYRSRTLCFSFHRDSGQGNDPALSANEEAELGLRMKARGSPALIVNTLSLCLLFSSSSYLLLA